jgi:HSP20 family molecular chaperone IbpA
MANATQQIQKQEAQAPQGAEFTRTRRVFMPRADIYETPDSIVVLADMPGVDEKGLDITLEKNVLTISGRVGDIQLPQDARLAYEEFEVGDYQRAFTLSDEVDRERIEATLKQGVLKLVLPKATQARMRKIAVKAE